MTAAKKTPDKKTADKKTSDKKTSGKTTAGGKTPGAKTSPPAVEAEFVKSAARRSQFPGPEGLEVAVMGRSNCGKSSLLNRWLGRRALARVGNTPGRTRLVNFFRVVWRPGTGPMTVVDLPGYGFAAAPKAMVDSWREMVSDYLTAARPQRMALLLTDVRRKAGAEERNLARWLGELGVPYLVVATKADKIPAGQVRTALSELAKILGGSSPPLAFSSLSGQGREELVKLVLDRQALAEKEAADRAAAGPASAPAKKSPGEGAPAGPEDEYAKARAHLLSLVGEMAGEVAENGPDSSEDDDLADDGGDDGDDDDDDDGDGNDDDNDGDDDYEGDGDGDGDGDDDGDED
ncbi:MAG: ribosome biogenesis GTP-binding protein YihA/YsxC [Deltaproteobacteria bacterium]|nr:ribosome biogenesis GTP-binding protein YihA/YsxC [Deltaproteobacteria bacterium]